ncbi:MAG: MBL fold metallo-hydrolase [Desulfovibrio sp.]|nr:MBL fold metallo-hydrolase [Desulfovibrio sp.]
MLKPLVYLLLFACLVVYPKTGQSAEVNTYTLGPELKILRILDKPNKIGKAYLLGAKDNALDSLLENGLCPSSYSTFLIVKGKDSVLIDTGNGASNQGKTLELLALHGFAPKSIKNIVLTHMHGDHILGLFNGQAKAFPEATVYVEASEYKFWSDRKNMHLAPKGQAKCFDLAEAFKKTYGDKVKLFQAGETLFKFLKTTATPGHTTGHTSFELSLNDQKYLIVGDVLHCLKVQTLMPQVTVPWDTDQNLAIKTREKLLNEVADTQTVILGSHFPEPGAFHISKNGSSFSYLEVTPK